MTARSILIKPASGNCNMRCSYCFYIDETQNRKCSSFGFMDDNTAQNIVKKSLSESAHMCSFAFQGGEPMLAGIDFFERFVEQQKKYNVKGLKIYNALQTNGTLITKEFAEFFKKHNFLVGVSVDGNARLHDAYRKDISGAGTHDIIMKNIVVLKAAQVDFNILTVLHSDVARNIKDVYRYFVDNKLFFQQYIPHIDPISNEKNSNSLGNFVYVKAMKTLFDLWYKHRDEKKLYIRYFENIMGLLMGYPPESCDMRGSCAPNQYAIEADGGVYPCDFYMLDSYCLGNINVDSFGRFDENRDKIRFVQNSQVLNEKCRSCKWLSLCRGGCMRYREAGIYRLCEANKEIFPYIVPKMQSLINRI